MACQFFSPLEKIEISNELTQRFSLRKTYIFLSTHSTKTFIFLVRDLGLPSTDFAVGDYWHGFQPDYRH